MFSVEILRLQVSHGGNYFLSALLRAMTIKVHCRIYMHTRCHRYGDEESHSIVGLIIWEIVQDDLASESRKLSTFTDLLNVVRLCKNSIQETRQNLEDLSEFSGYGTVHLSDTRSHWRDLYRPIPRHLGLGEAPDSMSGIHGNWKVVMGFYEDAEKEFSRWIEKNTADVELLRQGVSLFTNP